MYIKKVLILILLSLSFTGCFQKPYENQITSSNQPDFVSLSISTKDYGYSISEKNLIKELYELIMSFDNYVNEDITFSNDEWIMDLYFESKNSNEGNNISFYVSGNDYVLKYDDQIILLFDTEYEAIKAYIDEIIKGKGE